MRLLILAFLALQSLHAADFHATTCEGIYPRHLQGICTNDKDAIYWCWTDFLVKTDTNGHVLQKVPVANHHGDLCFHAGSVYVATNLAKFNRPQVRPIRGSMSMMAIHSPSSRSIACPNWCTVRAAWPGTTANSSSLADCRPV